jgi:hypothetical protein
MFVECGGGYGVRHFAAELNGRDGEAPSLPGVLADYGLVMLPSRNPAEGGPDPGWWPDPPLTAFIPNTILEIHENPDR